VVLAEGDDVHADVLRAERELDHRADPLFFGGRPPGGGVRRHIADREDPELHVLASSRVPRDLCKAYDIIRCVRNDLAGCSLRCQTRMMCAVGHVNPVRPSPPNTEQVDSQLVKRRYRV
jgi:hypothetical protein